MTFSKPTDESADCQTAGETTTTTAMSTTDSTETHVKREKEKQKGVEWRKTVSLLGGVAILLVLFWAAVVEQQEVSTRMWGVLVMVVASLLSYGTGRDILEGDSLLPGK